MSVTKRQLLQTLEQDEYSSMTIYQPYTYVITHLKSGKKYYGVRFAKGCHPSDLWASYYTSSVYVKRLIDEDGIDAFSVEVRRTFSTREAALSWEQKVLRRMKLARHPEWINRSSGFGDRHCSQTGWSPSQATRDKISKVWKGKKQPQSLITKRVASVSRTWKVTTPDGSIHIVTNLKDYCRTNNLNPGNMSSVASGKLPHHKKFLCEKYQNS